MKLINAIFPTNYVLLPRPLFTHTIPLPSVSGIKCANSASIRWCCCENGLILLHGAWFYFRLLTKELLMSFLSARN